LQGHHVESRCLQPGPVRRGGGLRRWGAAIGVLAGLAASPLSAQPGGGELQRQAQDGSGAEHLFISPCGQPFRSRGSEPYPVVAWFTKVDANSDGFVDRTELHAEATVFFQLLDVNKDGFISGPEITRYEHEIVPEITSGPLGANDQTPARILVQMGGLGGMGGTGTGDDSLEGERPSLGSGGAGGGASMEGAALFTLLGEPEPVSGSDLNLDGRVSLAELIAAVDRRFQKLDRKGADRLALGDLPLTRQQRMVGQRQLQRQGRRPDRLPDRKRPPKV
jgi:hypothetical protein